MSATGRPPCGCAPHRGGRRDRRRRGSRRSARRQGRSQAFRIDKPAARRGSRRHRARPLGPRRTWLTRSALRPRCSHSATLRFDPQLAEEFFRAFAAGAALTLHVRMVTGRNAHHVLEATFKGVARCLYDAVPRRARGRALDEGNARHEAAGEVIAVVDYGIGNLRSAREGARSPGR